MYDNMWCVMVGPIHLSSPAPPTDPMMTPANTPLSAKGLGTLGESEEERERENEK